MTALFQWFPCEVHNHAKRKCCWPKKHNDWQTNVIWQNNPAKLHMQIMPFKHLFHFHCCYCFCLTDWGRNKLSNPSWLNGTRRSIWCSRKKCCQSPTFFQCDLAALCWYLNCTGSTNEGVRQVSAQWNNCRLQWRGNLTLTSIHEGWKNNWNWTTESS